ncbi:MAG: hypothetical protein FWB97_08100 [Oscillospiraceae bacterium]|nr:hypothetical protein [Oscillospiraceae bacterium]
MRVHSTNEVNTTYPENPFVSQQAGVASTGEPASKRAFDDYLKSQIQQAGNQPVDQNKEAHVSGLLGGGFQPVLKVLPRPEPTLEEFAY